MSLSAAVGSGSLRRIRQLIVDGADVNEPGVDGTTPLCCAAMWGMAEAAAVLIENGADVKTGSPGTGATPLHLAAFQAQGKVAMLLLGADADPLVEDRSGRTPADYASVSEAIWPLFAAKGCKRSSKERLLRLGIIRKQVQERISGNKAAASKTELSGSSVDYLSRPGSSYGRSRDAHPLALSYGPSRDGYGAGGVGSGTETGGDVLATLEKGGRIERRRNESIGRLGL